MNTEEKFEVFWECNCGAYGHAWSIGLFDLNKTAVSDHLKGGHGLAMSAYLNGEPLEIASGTMLGVPSSSSD